MDDATLDAASLGAASVALPVAAWAVGVLPRRRRMPAAPAGGGKGR